MKTDREEWRKEGARLEGVKQGRARKMERGDEELGNARERERTDPK